MRIRQINKAYANYIHLKVKNDFGIDTRRETRNSHAKIPNLYHKSNSKTDRALEISPSTPRGRKTPPKIFQETRENFKKMWTCQHARKATKEKWRQLGRMRKVIKALERQSRALRTFRRDAVSFYSSSEFCLNVPSSNVAVSEFRNIATFSLECQLWKKRRQGSEGTSDSITKAPLQKIKWPLCAFFCGLL